MRIYARFKMHDNSLTRGMYIQMFICLMTGFSRLVSGSCEVQTLLNMEYIGTRSNTLHTFLSGAMNSQITYVRLTDSTP